MAAVIIRRTKKEHEKVKSRKSNIRNPFDFKYFQEKFPKIDGYYIFSVYSKSRWILFTCDKNLDNTKDIHPGFFNFMVAICLKIGKKAVLKHVHKGGDFYKFIKMNGVSNGFKNDNNKKS